MARQTERPQKFPSNFVPIGYQGSEETMIHGAIFAKLSGRFVQGSVQGNGRSVIKRMSQRQIGLYPFQAIIRQRQALEKWRTHSQRVNGGADVVAETRKRQFSGAHPTANSLFVFQQQHPPALAYQSNPCG
jgi:hypothetical protein